MDESRVKENDQFPFGAPDELYYDPLEEDEAWEMIHCAPREQAIEAGALVPYQFAPVGSVDEVCFTRALYAKYRNAPSTMQAITQKGISQLKESDPHDNEYRKIREVVRDHVYAIEYHDGITFLTPQEC